MAMKLSLPCLNLLGGRTKSARHGYVDGIGETSNTLLGTAMNTDVVEIITQSTSSVKSFSLTQNFLLHLNKTVERSECSIWQGYFYFITCSEFCGSLETGGKE